MSIFKSSRVFWLAGLPAVLILLFLTVAGSRLLINPGTIEITPCGDIVMFRSYPLVDVLGASYPIVRYVTTVTPLTPETNNGYVCREDNAGGQRYDHDHKRGFGKWDLRPFAEDCMADPVGFRFNTQHTALLFGLIPLRPISVSEVVVTREGGWELCPFRAPDLRGPPGPQGERGPAGPPGPQGPQGRPGGYAPQYGMNP